MSFYPEESQESKSEEEEEEKSEFEFNGDIMIRILTHLMETEVEFDGDQLMILFKALQNLLSNASRYSSKVHESFIPIYQKYPQLFMMYDAVGKYLFDCLSVSNRQFFHINDQEGHLAREMSVNYLTLLDKSTNDESKSSNDSSSPKTTNDDIQERFIQQFSCNNKMEVRLHVCGDGQAGKTTLIKMLLNKYFTKIGKFFGGKNETQRTVGILFQKQKKIDKKYYTLFDYGGQKEFHITHDRFFKGHPSIFVIVVSLVDEKGNTLRFEDLQFQILYWNRFVNTCCEEGSEKILVFSKLNLCSEYSSKDKKTLIDHIKEKIDTDIEVYFVGEGNMSDLGEFFSSLRKAHNRISKVFIIFYLFFMLFSILGYSIVSPKSRKIDYSTDSKV